MDNLINDLREELAEMRADMDELAKSDCAAEVLINMEERYHRVRALLNALGNEND
jgi:hypothetical protein